MINDLPSATYTKEVMSILDTADNSARNRGRSYVNVEDFVEAGVTQPESRLCRALSDLKVNWPRFLEELEKIKEPDCDQRFDGYVFLHPLLEQFLIRACDTASDEEGPVGSEHLLEMLLEDYSGPASIVLEGRLVNRERSATVFGAAKARRIAEDGAAVPPVDGELSDVELAVDRMITHLTNDMTADLRAGQEITGLRRREAEIIGLRGHLARRIADPDGTSASANGGATAWSQLRVVQSDAHLVEAFRLVDEITSGLHRLLESDDVANEDKAVIESDLLPWLKALRELLGTVADNHMERDENVRTAISLGSALRGTFKTTGRMYEGALNRSKEITVLSVGFKAVSDGLISQVDNIEKILAFCRGG